MFSDSDDEFPCGQRHRPPPPRPRNQVRKQKPHIRLTPTAHQCVQTAKKEAVRLAGLRNRVQKQATKFQEDLERGELPDWVKVRKNLPTLPFDMSCPPEMIVSWKRKLAECTMELGRLILDEYQSKVASLEVQLAVAKTAGLSLIDAGIKDRVERRRAHRVFHIIIEAAEQKEGLFPASRGGRR